MRTLLLIGCAICAVCVHGVDYKKRFVCYFTNWSQYRLGVGRYTVEDVEPDLCTHIVYSFIDIGEDYMLKLREWNDDQQIKSLLNLRLFNPDLLITVAVGGWKLGTEAFTRVCSSEANINTFVTNTVQFLRQHKFDGIDIDWEFPGSAKSHPRDKQRFTTLLEKMKAEFKKEAAVTGNPQLLLTAAVAAGKTIVKTSYEIEKICKVLDLVHLMSYDLNGPWEAITGHHSSLRRGPNTVEDSLNIWLNGGCPRQKMILGIPLYGRGFTISRSNSGFGAPVLGPSKSGEYTKEPGFLAYYEICNLPGTPIVDSAASAPYKAYGDQWIGYENEVSVREKVQFLQSKGLAGAMIWTLDFDDFRGICPTKRKNILSRAIKDALKKRTTDTDGGRKYRDHNYAEYL